MFSKEMKTGQRPQVQGDQHILGCHKMLFTDQQHRTQQLKCAIISLMVHQQHGNSILGISVYISGGSSIYIRMRDDELTSADLINQFNLEKYNAGTPNRLIWLLNTPIESDIELPEILLKKGTTVIGFGTTTTPPSASFKYIGSKF